MNKEKYIHIKKFLCDLFLNSLDKADYFFIVLLSALLNLYPSELVEDFQNANVIGKRFIDLVKEGISENKLKPFARLMLKEPMFLGFPSRNLRVGDLSQFLSKYGFTPSIFANKVSRYVERRDSWAG